MVPEILVGNAHRIKRNVISARAIRDDLASRTMQPRSRRVAMLSVLIKFMPSGYCGRMPAKARYFFYITQIMINQQDKENSLNDSNFKIIGWISHGMNVYKTDQYKAMFSQNPDVRKPPKIYKTESIARKYGDPTPVYVKINV